MQITSPAAAHPFSRQTAVHNAVNVINGLSAASVGQPDSARQVLVFMGIMAWIEPFELQRLSLLAQAWNARVTAVDAPGCGYGGTRLTPSQRRALRCGDFAAVARQMVLTAQAHNPQLRHGHTTVVGYSLGSSLAAAAAADPGLMRVKNMLLVEPVALRRRTVAALLRAVRSENRVVNEYLDLNEGIAGQVEPPQRRSEPIPPWSTIDIAHLGYGLSRGQLARNLVSSRQIQRFSVQVVHGIDSTLSPPADVRSLIRQCRRDGLVMHDIAVTGRHALWHSLSEVTKLAARVRDSLD
ncbi:alpha/beta fold hydrolase [Mycobacterium intracellulare]|uniref:alpha/beta fold hydrolase n=1 Tax=Mycobacterium intracellulare TaxID=1767 RepID=UPI001CD9634A|nr:alpha/beta fold hydrolase [Mycobacterium intracellulare]MCA2272427.1 alpha/beta fold hydrolase [Mycobacterium intracellulare]